MSSSNTALQFVQVWRTSVGAGAGGGVGAGVAEAVGVGELVSGMATPSMDGNATAGASGSISGNATDDGNATAGGSSTGSAVFED